MSVLKHQNLTALAAKYLKSKTNTNTLSKQSSKSYAIDLGQFLQKLEAGKIYTIASNSGEMAIKSKGGAPKDWSREELLSGIRRAQNSWRELALASRNRKAAALKAFFKWLYHEGVASEDLSRRIQAPKVPRKIPHFLSVDEVLALINKLEQTLKQAKEDELKKCREDLLLVLLLYGGGLRVSEACGLKSHQLQGPRAELRLRGKGGKERIVILPKKLWTRIAKLFDKSYLYIWGEKALHPRKAYEMVRQAGAAASLLQPLHPHALRHSFATHMLSGGSDLRILQELLGHESLAATEKYLHLGLQELAQSLEENHPLSDPLLNPAQGKKFG